MRARVPEVRQWWAEHVGRQRETVYTKEVVRRFAEEAEPQLLIVVDKLLTGF